MLSLLLLRMVLYIQFAIAYCNMVLQSHTYTQNTHTHTHLSIYLHLVGEGHTYEYRLHWVTHSTTTGYIFVLSWLFLLLFCRCCLIIFVFHKLMLFCCIIYNHVRSCLYMQGFSFFFLLLQIYVHICLWRQVFLLLFLPFYFWFYCCCCIQSMFEHEF